MAVSVQSKISNSAAQVAVCAAMLTKARSLRSFVEPQRFVACFRNEKGCNWVPSLFYQNGMKRLGRVASCLQVYKTSIDWVFGKQGASQALVREQEPEAQPTFGCG